MRPKAGVDPARLLRAAPRLLRGIRRRLRPRRVSAEAARWAIRLFLGREPTGREEVAFHRGHGDLNSLRTGFARTREFREFLARIGGEGRYAAPLFLLRPPASPLVPWHFAPPSLAAPVSQLCTAAQLEEPDFAWLCGALGLRPDPHRKVWEFAFVVAALRKAGLLRPGLRALGFGVGQEPIPAFLARQGISVLATDAPPEAIAGQGWESTGQHATGLAPLRRPSLVPNPEFDRLVRFTSCDMNAIPPELEGFDLCWSSCAFEHLGSIEHGLRFVEESLRTLKPGGLAVHTTEFNLSSDAETFEEANLCLFRRHDLEALLERLAQAGHRPWPLNLHPGDAPMDEHVDLPPYALPHLKLLVSRFVTTSIGIVVQKAG
ncbi:class I SAM-dependent methyltransferase [Paracraurococcus lichenis]|uniref:Class I SAM-dependent methyltransferase n=1 Tax=Paracraurococcus lichenis TaxID=3064888 RepID=A0ABT9DUH3_9PROT|nr:class I SAM-dependent methyltransferase [Paracraurococcus sp. LOR1-02]MDO9707547.1 class I SAM-dependent methyltransferase [Paracraurococcus sp. LOR1-02]